LACFSLLYREPRYAYPLSPAIQKGFGAFGVSTNIAQSSPMSLVFMAFPPFPAERSCFSQVFSVAVRCWSSYALSFVESTPSVLGFDEISPLFLFHFLHASLGFGLIDTPLNPRYGICEAIPESF